MGLPTREKDDYDIKGKHKGDIMKSLVHAADVGNPSRPYDICKVWSLKILSEFFAQVNLTPLYFRGTKRETWD